MVSFATKKKGFKERVCKKGTNIVLHFSQPHGYFSEIWGPSRWLSHKFSQPLGAQVPRRMLGWSERPGAWHRLGGLGIRVLLGCENLYCYLGLEYKVTALDISNYLDFL